MDKYLRPYYETALKLKLPVTYLQDLGCLLICLGRKKYYFTGSIPHLNAGSSSALASNKYALNRLLLSGGYSVPKNALIDEHHFAVNTWMDQIRHLKFPLVAKPLSHPVDHQDVRCNIQTQEELAIYLEEKLLTYPYVMIEEFHGKLKEYSVLVLKGRVINVLQCMVQIVVGDGQKTIEALLHQKNKQSITINHLDIDYQRALRQDKSFSEYIPAEGESVRVRFALTQLQNNKKSSARRSSPKIHRKNKITLQRAARHIDLDLVAFDVLCEDIERRFMEQDWFILKANFAPGLAPHQPLLGKTADRVSKKILRFIIFKHPFAYLRLMLKNWFFVTAKEGG